LATGRAKRYPVIVSKLDRLSRDVAFVAGLMAEKVPFIVAELGEMQILSCCTFTLHWWKKSDG
jgi:hypothetical protein